MSLANIQSPTFTAAAPGTYNYTCTITDACGATATYDADYTVSPVSPTLSVSGPTLATTTYEDCGDQADADAAFAAWLACCG